MQKSWVGMDQSPEGAHESFKIMYQSTVGIVPVGRAVGKGGYEMEDTSFNSTIINRLME
ncbi:MAG: hypothetical protein JEZ14_20210 [Marinilabiliaceae bacterium]|nr:hypothetical protein [Marinilabiliaceae bacterium]